MGRTPLRAAPLPLPERHPGGRGSTSHWSWAEGLVPQVNLPTWRLWLAAGEMRSTEKLPEPGHGAAIALGDEEWQDGLTETAGLPSQLISTHLPRGACLWLGRLCPGPPTPPPAGPARWSLGQGTLTRPGQSREAFTHSGHHRVASEVSCGLDVSPGFGAGRRGLWFVDWGPWTIGTGEDGDQRQKARKKTSGEGPEGRQRGLLPAQEPCELISSG